MQTTTFRIHNRFREFWQNIDPSELKSIRFIINAVGWIISYFCVIVSIESSFIWMILWIVAHGYFWINLNRDILKKIKPPVELLLLLILFFSAIDFIVLNSAFSSQLDAGLNAVSGGVVFGIFHKIFTALLILFFGLILVENNNNKQRVLIIFVLIGYIANKIVFFDHIYYLYILQFILFFSLLKRTIWLEKLTKIELWIYFIVFLLLFLQIEEPSVFQRLKICEIDNKVVWYSLPYFIYLLINLYFLSLLIKIPVIMIYNHAGLSRKLWIAGLFQSTFPQFIQLITLLFIFYFFISGWQADNLRRKLNFEIDQIKDGKISKTIIHKKISYKDDYPALKVNGYKPAQISKRFTGTGIISLAKKNAVDTRGVKKNDYFLFFKSSDSLTQAIHFVKVDTSFIRKLTENMSVLAGSGIISYSYTPANWQASLYKFDFWQGKDRINIYPFSVVSDNSEWSIETIIKRSREQSYNSDIRARIQFTKKTRFIVGRIFIPVINDNLGYGSYFAFDIYFDLESLFQFPFLMKIILSLIILFSLFNLLVVRQVVKFGSQINKMIVQKFEQLKRGIREISSGNLDYKVKLEGEDEFVEFADRFNKMGEKLQETIAEAREKDRLDQELKIARQVQLSLLPAKLPKVPGYQIVASLTTATEVGGDFYDLIPLDKNRFLFTIGDVSGKGSSAALYMAQFMSLLRYSPQFTDQPAEIALRLNEYFACHIMDRQIFVTAVIGILDLDKNSIRFVRAGHNLPVLIPGDKTKEMRELNISGLGIGLTKSNRMFKKELEVQELKLKEADMLVFYTDGVIEAARQVISDEGREGDDKMEIYGEKRFMETLNKARGKEAAIILNELSNDLNEFYAEHPRVDDHTLLLIKRSDS